LITVQEIIGINTAIIGTKTVKESLVGSAVSSYHYYKDIKHQIISIVRGISKNHAFADGNKRTALCVLYYLSEKNNLKVVNDEELFDLMIHMASTKESVEELSAKIFI
jgi:death-on-curing family protein